MKKLLTFALTLSAMLSMMACDDDSKKSENTDNKSVCTEGELRCGDKSPEECKDNAWKPLEACNSNQTCKSGKCENNTAGGSGEGGTGTGTGEGGTGTGTGEGGTGTGDVTNPEDEICKDAKSEYFCDGNDYIVCVNGQLDLRKSCAKALGTDYEGDICVTDNKIGHCGCNSDSDCRSGMKCDTSYNYCYDSTASSECSEAACKAKTDDNYQGNACVDHYGITDCGCNTNDDCKEGYSCSAYGYCMAGSSEIGSCKASECKAQTGDNYQGDVCIEYTDGIGYCGCASNNDCKEGYHCSNWGICNEGTASTNDCDPESCKAGIPYYQGNICVDYYEDGKFFDCGCYSDSDCNADTKCIIEDGYKAGYCF